PKGTGRGTPSSALRAPSPRGGEGDGGRLGPRVPPKPSRLAVALAPTGGGSGGGGSFRRSNQGFTRPMDLTTIDRPPGNLCVLRCPGCGGEFRPRDEASALRFTASLRCDRCDETFPVIDGIPRMLLTPLREALGRSGPHDGADPRQVATAQSFGFEWS